MFKRNRGSAGFLIIIYILGFLILAIGWIINLVKFCKCDFEAPYKAEVIRGVSIFVAPVGGVMGYINIDDTIKEVSTE